MFFARQTVRLLLPGGARDVRRLQSTGRQSLLFYVNGVRHEVDPRSDGFQADETLLEFLRRRCGLTGVKLACGEGGCGCCTVFVSKWDANAGRFVGRPVNSCLAYVGAMDGASITTVEAIHGAATPPRRPEELHPVQRHMAEHYGSQCGFCTPGFVMALYSHVSEHPDRLQPDDLHHCLDGNLCRCTGYRPIADALAGLSSELRERGVPPPLPIPDELLQRYAAGQPPAQVQVASRRGSWYNPTSVRDLLVYMKANPDARLVSGGSEVCIENRIGQRPDVKKVGVQDLTELKRLTWDVASPTGDGQLGVSLGPNLPLADVMAALQQRQRQHNGRTLNTAQAVLDNLRWFAGHSLRSVATLAGNIMTASPISDLNPILVASGAMLQLTSLDEHGALVSRWLPARHFFGPGYKQVAARRDEVLSDVWLPYREGRNEYTAAFKQSRRREDDIAIVNGCLYVRLNDDGSVADACFAYGGMGPAVVVAAQTAQLAVGKPFAARDTLDALLASSVAELALPPRVPGGMPEYRCALAAGFLQKFWSSVLAARHDGSLAADELSAVRPLTGSQSLPGGSQDYLRPLLSESREMGQPRVHRSALRQTTGEAVYTDDLPRLPNELQAALVLSTVAKGRIASIDASQAQTVPGFRGFFTRQHVPGSNAIGDIVHDEDLFADVDVSTYAQLIGIVVCDDELDARRAAQLVRVVYASGDDDGAVLTIDDACRKGQFLADAFVPTPHTIVKGGGDGAAVEEALARAPRRVRGSMRCGGQEHFYFEPMVTLAVPTDSEMKIFSSTQNLNKTQLTVSSVLGEPAHRVTCSVRRIGGGFGGKETDNIKFAAATAVAARLLNRPVRLLLPRELDFDTTGKRHAFVGHYDVGFDDSGRVSAADLQLYSNAGNWTDLSFPVLDRALFHSDGCYDTEHFRVRGQACQTNTVSNTAFRGFGGPQGLLLAESWVEHVAHVLGKRPEDVRQVNLYRSAESRTHFGQQLEIDLPRLWRDARASFKFDEVLAQVRAFNASNKYRKQGVALLPTKFGLAFTFTTLNQGSALVHVYGDGSVLITHGGVEMGQGLHTKMIQIAAETLGVDVDSVYIAETSTDKIANASASAASMSSDIYGMAVLNACRELTARLQPYRTDSSTAWLAAAAKKAYFDRVSLSALGFHKVDVEGYNMATGRGTPFRYFTSGVAQSHVELDTLTGDFRVIASDILMDVGKSLNPAIDVGQIEGAFVQGMGWSTIEELVWNDADHDWATPKGASHPSGRLLTRGPGAYKIPSMDDIPRRFNVTLARHSPNPHAVGSSRGIGEPPFFLGASVYFALRDAVRAAQTSPTPDFLNVQLPYTCERIRMSIRDPIVELVCKGGAYTPKGSY